MFQLSTIDAESVTIAILDMLETFSFAKNIIIGLVFDTTSTNSGHILGIVVRLEEHFVGIFYN